jgi:hypothetical protein
MKYQVATIILGLTAAALTVFVGNILQNMTLGLVISFAAHAVVLGLLVLWWETRKHNDLA